MLETLSSIFTVSLAQSALELGCIYALVALALFISYGLLNIADLSTDGCFTLGCAVGATVTMAGHPYLALFAAAGAGALSGLVTALLQTQFGIESILAGIVVNTGLYTINIMAMGSSSQMNIFGYDTVFTIAKENLNTDWYELIVIAVVVAIVAVFLTWFLGTRLGLSIRATGDNEFMVRASSINPKLTITVGLVLSNSLTGLAGGLLAQYQRSCDINIGTGQVTIALASLIIGQTLFGKHGHMAKRVVGVIAGSCLYRFIVAIALRFDVPAESLKLISAIIVAIAIALPYLKDQFQFHRTKRAAIKKRAAAAQLAAAGAGTDATTSSSATSQADAATSDEQGGR